MNVHGLEDLVVVHSVNPLDLQVVGQVGQDLESHRIQMITRMPMVYLAANLILDLHLMVDHQLYRFRAVWVVKAVNDVQVPL